MKDTQLHDVLDRISDVSATQREILANQSNQQRALELHAEILSKQGETLLRNTITVEEHHKRSTMMENRQDKLEGDIQVLKIDSEKQKSNSEHLKEVMSTVTLYFGAASAIGGVLWAIYEVLKKLGV